MLLFSNPQPLGELGAHADKGFGVVAYRHCLHRAPLHPLDVANKVRLTELLPIGQSHELSLNKLHRGKTLGEDGRGVCATVPSEEGELLTSQPRIPHMQTLLTHCFLVGCASGSKEASSEAWKIDFCKPGLQGLSYHYYH